MSQSSILKRRSTIRLYLIRFFHLVSIKSPITVLFRFYMHLTSYSKGRSSNQAIKLIEHQIKDRKKGFGHVLAKIFHKKMYC